MNRVIARRGIWAVVVAAGLCSAAAGTLWLADTYASDASTYCSVNLRWWQWLGCAMAAHEALAAGLIGAAGALFAGWLAFDAIQEQLLREQERDAARHADDEARQRQREREAKEAATVCIAQPVHAAASGLSVIRGALGATDAYQRTADAAVRTAAEYAGVALDSFAIREVWRDLDADDRIIYLTIVGVLSAYVSVTRQQSPLLNRTQRLEAQRDTLMKLHHYLGIFDAELAAVFARDSGTQPPTS
jgi:hypothetical protein